MEKKDKKKWSKRLLKVITFGFMAVFLVACGGGSDTEPTQEEVIEAEVEKRMAEEEGKEEYNSNAHREQIEETDEILISEVVDILEDNFSSVGYVEYNEADQVFSVVPTDPRFMDEIVGIYNGNLPESQWYEVVDSFTSLSESVEGVLGSGYGLVLMNPDNLDNMLLWTEDGTLVYEMLELDEEEDVSSSDGMTNL